RLLKVRDVGRELRIVAPARVEVERDLPELVSECPPKASPSTGSGRAPDRSAGAACPVLAADEVDDSARTVGRKSGGRVGHHFNTFVLTRGDLLQRLSATRAGEQAGGLAIDENGDVGVTAKADVALQVNINGRDVAKDIGDR